MNPTAKVPILLIATVLLSGHLFSQNAENNFASIPVPASLALDSSSAASQDAAPSNEDAGLYTIFSNFGKKPDCYNRSNGWLVSGKDSPFVGTSQYIAMKFTPSSDASVREIKMALLWGGLYKDAAVVSLNEDSNGLPGNPIQSWVTGKLGMFGTPPCNYTMVKSKQGLPVQKGTQYWIVAEGRGTETNVWGFTYKGTQGDFAYDYNNEGWKIEYEHLSTFAVLGTQ